MSKVDELITIEECAKRDDIPLGRVALRKFVISHGLGVQVGGSKEHPWLVVDPAEVRRRLLENRYTKPARAPRKQIGFRTSRRVLHPDVNC